MASSKVLYFPTISVPSSSWLVRVLLYWDDVGTITPLDYVEQPELFDAYTLRLVQEQLVTQVIPARFVFGVPDFSRAFLRYLENLGPAVLDARRQRFVHAESALRVHLEKLHDLVGPLRTLGLSRPERGPWHLVESTTGKEFMCYLAACLGQLPDVDRAPITDDAAYLRGFVDSTSPEKPADRLNPLRLVVLNALFPAPQQLPDPLDLSRFKERNRDTLRRFRLRIEQELTDFAAMTDPTLRERRLGLFLEEAQDEIEYIKSSMASFGWRGATLAKVTAVLAASPGIDPSVGLAAAVVGAFAPSRRDFSRSPYLYAAEVQRVLS